MTLSTASRTSHLLQIQSLYWKNRSFLPNEGHYHDYYGYHDFEGVVEDSPSPSPSPEWTFDPSIGIIHAQDCSICRSYTKHVFIANYSKEASFKEALSAREKRVTVTFSDGVHAGRLLQQEHDNFQLACYREERDKALHSVEQKTKVLDATRKEMQGLRDQVLALQFTIDELSTRRDNDKVARVAEPPVESPESNMSLMELNSSVEVDYVDILSTPPLSPTDNYTIFTLLDIPTPDAGSPKATEAPDSLFRTPAFAEEPGVSNANALRPSEPATSPLKPIAYPPSQPQLASLPPKPFSVHPPTRSVPTPAAKLKPSRRFTTLAELQAAMKAAYEGDDSSLKAVRAFKASAHGKSPHRRTKLHRYAIKHWREPPTSYVSVSSVHTTLDGDTFSTEIYVDASQWGIGFVMDGLWFAWKFADSIVTTLSGSQIDSNWAEMLAVEVGLWTVIQWVCKVIQKEGGDLKSLEILVRSDNTGVVKAIERRHTNHPLQQDILRRILDMASEHDVELTMKWISSGDNLADKTSRGIPGRVADLLPFIPPLPSHLSDILGPISSNN